MGGFLALALLSVQSPPAPLGGSGVYKQALPAVVWIQSSRVGGMASGSGSLVDAGRRLVLTNYHVVEDNPKATVFFPEFRDDGSGGAVPEKTYYRDRAARLGVSARVIVTNRTADLALLQLARTPAGAKAIPLADASPGPGDAVHSIGNAGTSGALWGYVRGTVRQVYRKKWQAKLGSRRVQAFEARVIESDSPTNPGDSGGPLLNDAGRLVGVTQGGAVDAQSVSFFVDVSEVRKILETPEALAAPSGGDPDAPAKSAPVEVEDYAGLLSKQAATEASALLAELAKAGRPVRVVTLKDAPEALRAKLDDASPAERRKLFSEFAYRRLAATRTDGAIVLICKSPGTAVVVLTKNATKRYADGTQAKAADALLTRLKAQDFDGGVLAALKLLRDAKAGGD